MPETTPCNQFGAQDPGSEAEIGAYCRRNHGVSFAMMAWVEVKGAGAGAHPLWQWLSTEAPGRLGTRAVKWNFTRFLVGRDGRVRSRHAPTDPPESLAAAIEAELAASV